jgi:hypothetical protein
MATESGIYRDLLHSAYVRGRDDGVFAARFEPGECMAPVGPVCQGRTPADFARALWSPGPGSLREVSNSTHPTGTRAASPRASPSPGNPSAPEQPRPGPTAEAAGPSRGSSRRAA